VLITRHADHVELREISAALAALLTEFAGDATLAQAAESVLSVDADADFSTLLQQALRLQVLANGLVRPAAA